MNRPKIYVVPPEHITKAWPSIESLDIIVPAVNPDMKREDVFKSILTVIAAGNEELHVVLDGGGNTVACFTTIETKDSGLLVRFIAGKDAPVWIGYIMRNILELAGNRGLRYAKVISKAF